MDHDPNQPESSSSGQQPPPLSQRSLSQDEQPPLYESPPQWGRQPLPQYRQPPDGPPQYGGSPLPDSRPPQQPKKRSSRWLWIILAIIGGLVLGCIGSTIVVALTLSSFARLERPVTPPYGGSNLKPISFSVGAHPTIIISNAFSNTDIHAGSAKMVIINPTQGNDSFGIAPQINYSQDGNTITITEEGQGSVNLDVTMPKNADLQVETNSGDIDVTDVSGQMSLASTTGTINATNDSLSGQSTLEDNGGSINATNDSLSGQSKLWSTTGSVTFNGSIDPHGTYIFGSTSGSVDVTLPGNSSFHVDATAGSISSAFPEVKVSGAEAHGDVGSPPRATVTLSAGTSINLNKA